MRKLCWSALPCSVAIFLGTCFLPEGLLLPLGLCCGLGGLAAFAFRGDVRRRILLAAAGLSVGFLWTSLYGALFRAPARAYLDKEAQSYTFEVCQFPVSTSRGTSFSARIVEGDGQRGSLVMLYAGAEAGELAPGDRIRSSVRLAPSDRLRGEEVDFYEARGIYLLGYAQGGYELLGQSRGIPPRFWPQYVARAIQASILQVFPEDVAGFLAALTTGEKRLLPDGLYKGFQRSGIAHVVAVSGLHIGSLAGLVALLFGKRSRLGAVVGVGLMVFFAAVAGNAPSALRAVFMSTLLLLAPLVGREPDKPTTLAVVLLSLLLPCPYAAASVSLQLSFGAVAGIYLITESLSSQWLKAIPEWKGPFGRAGRKVLAFGSCSLAVTLGALLFTAPLSALYFRSASLVGLLVDLLTLWAVSGVFLGGLMAALIGISLPTLGGLLAWVVAWPARWVLLVAHTASALPFASLALLSGYLILWSLAAYLVLVLWFIGRRRIRPAIPAAALVLTLCAALAAHAGPIRFGRLTVTALDVGQGASTLFCSRGRAVLVDCGGGGAEDPGDVAADYLQALGTSRLDALVLTHYHTDHAVGVPRLLERLEVSLLILPDVTPEDPLRQEIFALARSEGCEVKLLSEDDRFSFGEAEMTLFAPLGDGGANEEGLSLVCSAGEFDALITGDMNDVVERRLVKYKSLPDIELLLVGHHGSKGSTSEELLLATRPELAAISSGYNSYGHPAPETLERLGAAGCDIYLTHDMGHVCVTYKGE